MVKIGASELSTPLTGYIMHVSPVVNGLQSGREVTGSQLLTMDPRLKGGGRNRIYRKEGEIVQKTREEGEIGTKLWGGGRNGNVGSREGRMVGDFKECIF